MRSPSDAGLLAWSRRIFRPWLLATSGGAAFGALLLSLPTTPDNDAMIYSDHSPRAAVSDASNSLASATDPFVPPPSLSVDLPAASAPADELLSLPDSVSTEQR